MAYGDLNYKKSVRLGQAINIVSEQFIKEGKDILSDKFDEKVNQMYHKIKRLQYKIIPDTMEELERQEVLNEI
jgi:acyl-ACP thioesterase